MTKIISVEEIGQCRSGPDNDIDLQAVFGGIKGRQPRGLKVNPLYDSNHSNNSTQHVTPDINGNINNVHVVTYKSIPEGIHDDETPVVNGTVDHEHEKDSNGNDSIDTKGTMIHQFARTNGSIKNHNLFHEGLGQPRKSNKMPEHLGRVESNGNPNDIAIDVQHLGRDMEVKHSSYKLLAYSNDGYAVDETDRDLEKSEGLIRHHSVTVDNVVIDVATEEERHDIKHEIQSVTKPISKDETQAKEEEKVEETQHSVKSKTIISVDKSDKCANSVTETSTSHSSTLEHSVKTEFVTEVHIHTVEINQNHSDNRNQVIPSSNQNVESLDSITADLNSVSNETKVETQQTNGVKNDESQLSVETGSIPANNNDTIDKSHQSGVNEIDKEDDKTDANSSKTVTFTKTENKEKAMTNGYETSSSSTRTIKSILLTTNGKQNSPPSSPPSEHVERKESFSEIQECKSVTFSDDTVFNENKSKRYKLDRLEKLNLRDIYRGKISSDTAMAKMNPLFKDDGEHAEGERSMSEDERIAYQIAFKKVMKSTKGKGKNLNTPAYMDHYLILKANGIKPANINADDLPEDIEQPAYDRLIQRTIAKARRKLIVKWTLVIITVAIVTAVATVLGVHFKDSG